MTHFVDQISLPITISHGEGCYVIDTDGKRYLDFIGGWCVASVGWGNVEIREALTEETKRGTYIPPLFRSDACEDLATELVAVAPGKMQKVFPCTSGSEAVDMAIKCVRAATGKDVIISIDEVYHGHTYGALSIGEARKRVSGSILPSCQTLPMPGREMNSERVLELLEKRLQKGDVAAFISEPVWTNAGTHIPPPGFYETVQTLCRKQNALLVMDEVATGFGHCGTLFGSELWNLEPDLLCIGKAFTGGYATMAALLTTEDVWKKSKGIPCYSTFAWLPTDLAATRANVNIILRDRLWENAKVVGAHLLSLLELLEKLSVVKEVRGIGLLFAIELKNPDLRLTIQQECAEEGLLIETDIPGKSLFFTPPLILSKKEAEEGAGILKTVLTRHSA